MPHPQPILFLYSIAILDYKYFAKYSVKYLYRILTLLSIINDGDADYGDVYAIVFGEYGERV